MTPEELDFYRNLDARLWGQERVKRFILAHVDAHERAIKTLTETCQSTLAQWQLEARAKEIKGPVRVVDTMGHLENLAMTPHELAQMYENAQKGNPVTRESWDDYFLRIAEVVASRSTCPRQHVGAVLVRDNRIITTGYNGSLPGESHCDDVGCEMEHGHCVRTIHAELNAILCAAKQTSTVAGATAYITHKPCPRCQKHLRAAGVVRFRFPDGALVSTVNRQDERTRKHFMGVPIWIQETVSPSMHARMGHHIHYYPGSRNIDGNLASQIAYARDDGKEPEAILVRAADAKAVREEIGPGSAS